MGGINDIELLTTFIDASSAKLKKISPQLYLLDGVYPRPYASSVLVKIRDRKFLVTAAHILEDTDTEQIKIGFGNKFITPLNKWYYLDNKKLDLAVMEINGDLEKGITENFEFYDLGSINPDHEILMDQVFFTFGYPASRTKVINKLKRLDVEVFAYSTELQNIESCQDHNVHPNTHLVLVLKKKISSSKTHNKISPPDQHGMSGSGIWHIPFFPVNPNMNNVPLILSGIYIEFHKRKSSIIATRTPVLTELLRQNFDCDLKKSRKVKLDIEV